MKNLKMKYQRTKELKIINKPWPKFERSTWCIDAGLDFESATAEVTRKEVDLIVNMHGLDPVYRTVERAFPA